MATDVLVNYVLKIEVHLWRIGMISDLSNVLMLVYLFGGHAMTFLSIIVIHVYEIFSYDRTQKIFVRRYEYR